MDTNIISQLISLATKLDELGETEKAKEVDNLTTEVANKKDEALDDEKIIQFIKLHHGPPKEMTIDHMPVEMTDEDFSGLDDAEKHIITEEANNIARQSKITQILNHIFFVEVPYHAEPDSPESLFYATVKQFGLGGSIVRLYPDKQGNHLRYVIYCTSLV